MPDSTQPRIRCDQCGKQYLWTAKLAGHKVMCKCGNAMRVPAQPPTGEGSTYDLTGGSGLSNTSTANKSADAPPRKCPSCNQPIKPGAVICINCGYDLRHGKAIKTTVQKDSAVVNTAVGNTAPPKLGGMLATLGGKSAVAQAIAAENAADNSGALRDWIIPCALIALALLVTTIEQTSSGVSGTAFAVEMTAYVIGIGIYVLILLFAVYIASKIGDIAYGPLHFAVLKLVAIVVGPGAIASLIGSVMPDRATAFGVGLIVNLAAYFGLIKYLFRLDLSETFATIIIIMIVRTLVAIFLMFVVVAVVQMLFG